MKKRYVVITIALMTFIMMGACSANAGSIDLKSDTSVIKPDILPSPIYPSDGGGNSVDGAPKQDYNPPVDVKPIEKPNVGFDSLPHVDPIIIPEVEHTNYEEADADKDIIIIDDKSDDDTNDEEDNSDDEDTGDGQEDDESDDIDTKDDDTDDDSGGGSTDGNSGNGGDVVTSDEDVISDIESDDSSTSDPKDSPTSTPETKNSQKYPKFDENEERLDFNYFLLIAGIIGFIILIAWFLLRNDEEDEEFQKNPVSRNTMCYPNTPNSVSELLNQKI